MTDRWIEEAKKGLSLNFEYHWRREKKQQHQEKINIHF